MEGYKDFEKARPFMDQVKTFYQAKLHYQRSKAICSSLNNVVVVGRGKVMSHRANKLQMPFLGNSIYSSDRFLERSINSCDNQINSCRY